MKAAFSDRFVKDYTRLPARLRDSVDKQIRLLLADPRHPSLDLKKMRDPRDIWRFKVTAGYRVTLQIEGDTYILRRVGPHDVERTP